VIDLSQPRVIAESSGVQPGQVGARGHPPANRRSTPLLLLGITIFLYLNLFALPNVPFLLNGDQVFFWMDAQRMLHGERAYLDFFQYTPPGADLFYLAVFKVLGPRIYATNIVVLGLGVALCWVCFRIAKKIMAPKLALLGTMLFLTLIYTRMLNATHHWFSVLLCMAAIWILMDDRSVLRLSVAGALLGLASFFTQSHGAATLLAVSVFLTWDGVRHGKQLREVMKPPAVVLLGFVLALLVSSSYFIATVGLKQLWYSQATYVRQFVVHRPETSLLGMPVPLSWRTGQYAFVYVLLFVVYPLTLWKCCARQDEATSAQHTQLALLSMIGFLLLVEVMFSLNWLRLYAVSMPGIILFAWFLGRASGVWHHTVTLTWIGVIGLGLLQIWSAHSRPNIITELRGGWAAVTPQSYEKLSWFIQHTQRGEFVFQARWPGMYLPLDLRNPAFIDAIGTTDQTRPQHVARTIKDLESRQVKYVLWSPTLNRPDGPGSVQENPITPLVDYLHSRYVPVHTFSDHDEVRERR
jgi:hypothetical protein